MIDDEGILLCARYALSPNFFGYCGPSQSASLVDHLKENIADQEMVDILSQFETLYPYLQLIARKNKLPSPFLPEVVEAYWLGNHLLQPLTPLEFNAFATERLFLEKRVGQRGVLSIMKRLFPFDYKKITASFLPHHSFHVFNIFKRTGKINNFQTLSTMDSCRIGWGKIIAKNEKLKNKNLLVESRPLLMKDSKLVLGKPITREIKIDYQGKIIIPGLKTGDWISFHWGYLCDRLTKRQIKNLEYYTIKAVEFYNQTFI